MGAYRVRIPPDVAGIHGRTGMTPTTSKRRRRPIIAAAILALLLTAMALGGGAAQADTTGTNGATITVTPNSGIAPGTSVDVQGSSFDAYATVYIDQCRFSPPNNTCFQVGSTGTDAGGSFDTQVNVSNNFSDGSPCFNGACYLRAFEQTEGGFTPATADISFTTGGVDLAVGLSGSPNPATNGSTVTWQTTVDNSGGSSANNVELFVQLRDANNQIISPSTYNGPSGCAPATGASLSGQGMLCNLGTIPGSVIYSPIHSAVTTSSPVTITVQAPSTGSVMSGQATAWSDEVDDSAGDNSDYKTVTLQSATEGDTTPPDTTITTEQVQPGSAKFTFTGSDPDDATSSLTYECSLDGATFTSCSSPKSYSALATSGSHTFAVRAQDPAGNVDPTPATFTWNGSDNEAEGSFPPGGGTATTAGPKGATPSDSTTTTMTSTVGGDFSIDETPYNAPGTLDCGSFTNCIGQDIQITFTQTQTTQAALLRTSTAPPPYRFKFAFTFDKSVLAGHPFATLTMIHDGVALPTCTRTLQQQRQQCVADRRHVGNGDERLIVLSNQNGSWRGH